MNGKDALKGLERANLLLLQNAISLSLRYGEKMDELEKGKIGEMAKELAKAASFSVYTTFDAVLRDPSEQARLLLAVREASMAIHSAIWNAILIGYDCSQQEQLARLKVAEE